MALPTKLDLVNEVLVRIREEEVSALAGDEYATLVGTFVNDAKSQVEDAHDWSCYLTDIDISTVASTSKYSLTNSANRVKIDNVVNASVPGVLQEASRRWIKQQIDTGATGESRPTYWANDGTDSNGDAQVSLYPIPSDAETIRFTGWQRAGKLTADTDTLAIPELPVVLLAVAFAVRERGEVGGQVAAEYFELAKRSLSDEIAYDSARNEDEDNWYWT